MPQLTDRSCDEVLNDIPDLSFSHSDCVPNTFPNIHLSVLFVWIHLPVSTGHHDNSFLSAPELIGEYSFSSVLLLFNSESRDFFGETETDTGASIIFVSFLIGFRLNIFQFHSFIPEVSFPSKLFSFCNKLPIEWIVPSAISILPLVVSPTISAVVLIIAPV